PLQQLHERRDDPRRRRGAHAAQVIASVLRLRLGIEPPVVTAAPRGGRRCLGVGARRGGTRRGAGYVGGWACRTACRAASMVSCWNRKPDCWSVSETARLLSRRRVPAIWAPRRRV